MNSELIVFEGSRGRESWLRVDDVISVRSIMTYSGACLLVSLSNSAEVWLADSDETRAKLGVKV